MCLFILSIYHRSNYRRLFFECPISKNLLQKFWNWILDCRKWKVSGARGSAAYCDNSVENGFSQKYFWLQLLDRTHNRRYKVIGILWGLEQVPYDFSFEFWIRSLSWTKSKLNLRGLKYFWDVCKHEKCLDYFTQSNFFFIERNILNFPNHQRAD